MAALLVHRAVGDRLTCVFVDHGLLRKGEASHVVEAFERSLPGRRWCTSTRSTASSAGWRGSTDPEMKRRIIGEEFIRLFEDEAARSWATSTIWCRARSTPT